MPKQPKPLIKVTWRTIGEQTATVLCHEIKPTSIYPGYLHLTIDGKGMVLHPDQIIRATPSTTEKCDCMGIKLPELAA